MNENKTNINWYPGHMAKTKRQIKDIIKIIDIVYEVIDARIPYSSKMQDVENLIKDKKRILIMTKKDLCDMNMTSKWKKYYEDKGYLVLIIDLKNGNDYQKVFDLTKQITSDIQNKRNLSGMKDKEIKALVIGIPNVGKSSLINQMVRKKVANVENKPGITKDLRFLPTNMGITLLDTPGILWPKMEDQEVALNIACIGSIKKDLLNMYDVASHIIKLYLNYYPNIIDNYGVNKDNIDDIIESLGRRWGFVYQNEVDYGKTCDRIYNDLVSGKVKNITLDICKMK